MGSNSLKSHSFGPFFPFYSESKDSLVNRIKTNGIADCLKNFNLLDIL